MKKTWRVILILAAPLVALGVLFAMPRPVDLIIDNTSRPLRMRIVVNGVNMGLVKRWGTLILDQGELHAGTLNLTAVEIGPEGQEGNPHHLTVKPRAAFGAPRPTYVWNIDGMTHSYTVVTQGYGDQEGQTFPGEVLEVESQFFQLPEDIIPTLNVNFPKNIERVSGEAGATGVTRRALFTGRFISTQAIKRKLGGQSGNLVQSREQEARQTGKTVFTSEKPNEAEPKKAE